MTNEELISLIQAYNDAETQQEIRLIALYRALRDRTSSARFVEFGRAMRWTTNDFQPFMEERFSFPSHVFVLVHRITNYNLGE